MKLTIQERVIRRVEKMTKKELVQSLVKAGILTKTGTRLSKRYSFLTRSKITPPKL